MAFPANQRRMSEKIIHTTNAFVSLNSSYQKLNRWRRWPRRGKWWSLKFNDLPVLLYIIGERGAKMNEKNNVLSQNEIDELLGKMGDSGETEKMSGNRVLSQPQIDKIFNVKPCDLGRADVFTSHQKQAISLMFELLARRMITYFSASLRQLCHFHLSSVDELTYV